MSVVDWSGFPEPFRRVGSEFSEMLPALVRGDPVPQPNDTVQLRPHASVLDAWIIERRMEMGLSQRELARRLGCVQARISEYERGTRQPSQATRERIAAILLPGAA